jgi:multimeric flavodoxin WrbA
MLQQAADPLRRQGIEVDIVHVGNALSGCKSCGKCAKMKNERCSIEDPLNDYIQQAKNADGLLFGSPVHFAGISGGMKSFLDRMFYVSSTNNNLFRYKAGAAVIAVRRSGGVAALDQLNHYLLYSEMVIPTSNYWNVGHGTSRGEVAQDLESCQIMQVLGENMAWLLRIIEAGKNAVAQPDKQKKVYMSFIR